MNAGLKNVAHKGFIPDTREIALAGLHKARLMVRKPFTKQELAASRDWLLSNGFDVPSAGAV